MATPSESPLRTFAFAALGQDAWLAGWFPGPGERGVLLVPDGAGVQAREASLAPGPEQAWALTAAGAELTIAATSPAAALTGVEGIVDGFEQAASVSGTLDGLETTLPGRRGERPGAGADPVDSVREMAVWFDDGEVVAISAVRPRKHKGHEQDAIHAAVLDPAGPVTIVEPRLSTTYSASGRARRVGLELWREDEEAAPVRVVAEGLGRGGSVAAGGWELSVDWLAGHRRGRDGAGVYLIARPS